MKSAIAATFCLALLGRCVLAQAGEECPPLIKAIAANKILLKAVEAAGFTDPLTKEGANFTIFAPTDGAFTDLLAELELTAEELLGKPHALEELLKYHVLPEPQTAVDLTAGGTFVTALPDCCCKKTDVDIKVKGDVVTIIGGLSEAKVTTADVKACSGTIVHVIDTVLLPCPVEDLGKETAVEEAAGSHTGSSGGSSH